MITRARSLLSSKAFHVLCVAVSSEHMRFLIHTHAHEFARNVFFFMPIGQDDRQGHWGVSGSL
jgi:hypothetical protein